MESAGSSRLELGSLVEHMRMERYSENRIMGDAKHKCTNLQGYNQETRRKLEL